jgi:TP901-1 family phage major tail protein
VRTARISGSGIFKDQASDVLIRQTFFAAQILRWHIVVPDFGTIAGPFQIANFEIAGRHDGEVTFDLVLESAGEITFTEI